MTDTDFNQALWQAVINRDSRFDGQFFYGVLTTGVFCRPSCSSRNPKVENVRFFRLPSLAQKAGFRPCKRCHPEEATSHDPTVVRAEKLCRILEEEVEEGGSLESYGKSLRINPDHLRKTFKQVVGLTPKQYRGAVMKGRLQAALKENSNVAQAIYQAGYGSSSRVYEQGDSLLGMSPATFAKGGKGAEIAYEIEDSPFGRLLVACTEKGICHLSLGQDDHLIAELKKDYPFAQVSQGDGRIKGWISDILSHLEGRLPNLKLPLDIRATAFQTQVWHALQKIPLGETRSYRDIAQSLGKPKSARAVGRACASNPVSLVIPCHRAVGSAGSLTGYRWGIERKAALLKHEKTKG
ncbi:MAG: bifunctional DNA-binding transcriptional regulator/O6-methylguanine-DNA methyltransferase Ada [Alphaproteobacteria bacterium]|nr:bifunctional DNA-binding transcriptional regulator/O6-methylguanine-DNA methyltransferase Ada [Rhodospirillales bacterium]MCW9045902.1 bifunctional DNA-binding transcriptional regulator/O6-methylguanine-DNA methyltransferase Ada [Alphaproteobacteria bacterium]